MFVNIYWSLKKKKVQYIIFMSGRNPNHCVCSSAFFEYSKHGKKKKKNSASSSSIYPEAWRRVCAVMQFKITRKNHTVKFMNGGVLACLRLCATCAKQRLTLTITKVWIGAQCVTHTQNLLHTSAILHSA